MGLQSQSSCIATVRPFAVSLLLGISLLPFGATRSFAQNVEAESRGTLPDDADLQAGGLNLPPPPADATLPEVAPIIPDDEFNAAVPSLGPEDDAELDQPLESIEAFESRLAKEAASQADANPQEGQAAPAGIPALADEDALEQIGDAPINDTELAAPLPPLEQFDVAPVQFAEDEEARENRTIPYEVKLNGLDLADKETEVSLKDQFKEFSALRDGDGKASNVAMVNARLAEDSDLVKNILASEGWYSPQIRTHIERGETENGLPLSAVIDVVPGERYKLSEIVVQSYPTEPPNLIESNLALEVGEPIVASRVQGAEAQVALALPQNGYPFAKVGNRDILLDPDTAEGVYTLPVDVGVRGRFGGFETDGDLAFDADHVRVLSRFKRGELYDSRKVDDLRKALVATSLFSTVAVEPKATGEQAGDGTEYVTMLVHQDAGPPRTIAGTLGYATGQGLAAEATWTHRNMFPPEGALIGHGKAGTQEQGAGVTFRRSNAGKRDRTFSLVAEALHSEYDAYSAYTGRLAARVARDSTPIWQKKYTYAYGIELLGTAETDYNYNTGERDRNTYWIASLNGQVGFDQTDDLLDPTRGFRLTTLVQPEASLGGGFNPYVRATLDGSAYYSIKDNVVLAGRLRFGTIQGAELYDIAPSRRLYSGGGGSVRGYGYQKLGPQDPNGDPIGGRSLNEASVEVRYRFGTYGVVGFVDAGQSYAATTPQFSDIRFGVGVGGRFYTNFGPVRLDLATPINRRPGEGRINIYVSIGQAF